MLAVRITVVAGLALLAGVLAVVGRGSPPTVSLASSAPVDAKLGFSYGPAGVCQGGEVLPAGTSAIRLLIHSPMVGPRVSVEVLEGAHVITRGTRGSGWTAGVVTAPVRPLARTVPGVSVCFAFARSAWLVGLTGRPTPPAVAARGEGQVLAGRVGIEYLRAGHRSWWSRVDSIARQMSFSRAGGGAWISLLVLALVVSIAGLSMRLVVQELR